MLCGFVPASSATEHPPSLGVQGPAAAQPAATSTPLPLNCDGTEILVF